MIRSIGSVLCGAIASILLTGGAAAQVPASADIEEAYGPGTQAMVIPPVAFTPGSSGYQFSNPTGDPITPLVDGEQRWFAPVSLPSGANVLELDVFVRDDDPTWDINVYAKGTAFPVSGAGTCGSAVFSGGVSTGISGQGIVKLTTPWGSPLKGRGLCNSVDSYLSYMIEVDMLTTSHAFSGARIVWSRSVSPPPVTATFNDVPTSHPFFPFIEALVASGITAGCGSGNYCPDNALTRGQMAVFLAKALGLHWPE